MLAGERDLLPLVQLHNEFFAKLFDQIAPDGLTGATDAWVEAADLAFPFRLEEIFPRSDLLRFDYIPVNEQVRHHPLGGL